MVNAFAGVQGSADAIIVSDLESLCVYFKLIFTNAFMELIVKQTNLRAPQC